MRVGLVCLVASRACENEPIIAHRSAIILHVKCPPSHERMQHLGASLDFFPLVPLGR